MGSANFYQARNGRRFFTLKGALNQEFNILVKRKYGGESITDLQATNLHVRFIRFWRNRFKCEDYTLDKIAAETKLLRVIEPRAGAPVNLAKQAQHAMLAGGL